MRRNQIIMGLGLLVIIAIVLVIWFRSDSSRPRPLPDSIPQLQEPRPIYDWYVCEDMGMGPVPGVSDPRQRFRVCHDQGWEVLAYCLQPNWPAPEVGAACALIDDNTFWCGEGIQNLREYAVLQTPVPTPTVAPQQTETPTPTTTSTPIAATQTPGTPLASATTTPAAGTGTPGAPTATPVISTATPVVVATQRPSPGGSGYLDWLVSLLFQTGATPTPFQPQLPTPTYSQPQALEAADSIPDDLAVEQPMPGFYGIDFSNPWERIRIKIYPPDWTINRGKPIVIAFTPGQSCRYGDRQACVNRYTTPQGGDVTYLTVHSGVNGEAETFRRAVEGFGFDQAGFPLRKIQARLRDLAGADVEIVQGETVVSGLELSVAVRIPPKFMGDYLESALPDALSLAASINPSMQGSLTPDAPQVMFETCGWKMPWEPWLPGMTSTNAS
ncbi:MAG: hypothetical protein ACWGO1_02190, partial [Anaerolineales bacterium]